eukprot:Opistho-1_new@43445
MLSNVRATVVAPAVRGIAVTATSRRQYASKVSVSGPVVELKGDDMAAVIWDMVSSKLIDPNVNLKKRTFDLSLANRKKTGDKVTQDALAAIREAGAAVKCSTTTPYDDLRSPNATIRSAIGGVIIREQIVPKNIPPAIPTWTNSITIVREAAGDQFDAQDFLAPGAGTFEMTFTGAGGDKSTSEVFKFKKSGVAVGMYNTDAAIESFAHACFRQALKRKQPLYLSSKNTILKKYDGRFKDIFQAIYDKNYKAEFEANKTWYEHRLIDDMVAFAIKSNGGFVWACKNYDGDVQSATVAAGFGSVALMTSALVSGDGKIVLAETGHGTIARHLGSKDKAFSLNPLPTIGAWSRALSHRATLDKNDALAKFAGALVSAAVETAESGKLTRDLARATGKESSAVSTAAFIDATAANLAKKL